MSLSHESAILRPRDPTQTNSDHWPEFELKNAFVYDPQDPIPVPVSLLHAGAYRPLTLTGSLGPANKTNAHVWLNNAAYLHTPIEITLVKEFSYGQYGDGSLDIWAAGQAGWFTIRPGRPYRATYNAMVQAVKLLYFAVDRYKDLKKYSDLPAAQFFQKCCDHHIETCKSAKEAEAMFTQHRQFLIASMLTGKEGLKWPRVPLFSWFQEAFPEDFQTIRQRIGYKPPKAPSRKGSTQSPAPSTASSRRKKATAKQQAGTPKSTVSSRSTRNTRATRSTRSQSVATVDNLNTGLETHPEVMSTPGTRNSTITEASSSSDDEILPKGPGKGKSALRPRPSKYIPLRTDNSVKDSPALQVKKTTSQPEEPELMSIDGPENSTQETSDQQTSDSDSEVTSEADRLSTSIPFRLQEAAISGDVWHCPTDGCMHKVYAASDPSSQSLVQAHTQSHQFDEDERIQLVRRMQAPWLPVNRLMDRVRGAASAQSKYPPPVMQRY